jgi:hypothetical protein
MLASSSSQVDAPPPLVMPTRKAARDRRTELSSNCAIGARRIENWLEVVVW